MFNENTVRQALAWVPPTESLQLVGAARAGSANDTPFLPAPPPSLASRIANFGGRQKRYKVQRQQQLRIYDPFEQAYVTFSHERYMLAWLLVRFSATVTELDAAPAPVGYLSGGRETVSRPHLTWRVVGSKRRVFFWLRQEWTEEERQRLWMFSKTHDVDVVLGTWDDLAAQEQLLDNLQAGRQRMTTVHHAGLDTRQIAREVLSHLRMHKGRATRGEIGAELCCRDCVDCDAQVDAALFHLHAVGRLQMDLADREFGDDTRVRIA